MIHPTAISAIRVEAMTGAARLSAIKINSPVNLMHSEEHSEARVAHFSLEIRHRPLEAFLRGGEMRRIELGAVEVQQADDSDDTGRNRTVQVQLGLPRTLFTKWGQPSKRTG